jgi:purine nucleoside phosphorylase
MRRDVWLKAGGGNTKGKTMQTMIGVIGGSGVYQIDGLRGPGMGRGAKPLWRALGPC